jgi:maltose O-acetyltransferase
MSGGSGEQRRRQLAGEWFRDDAELGAERLACTRLLDRYNATRADDDAEREQVLAELLGTVGPGCLVVPRFWCAYGNRISLGHDVFVNTGAVLVDGAAITLEDHVRLGPRVQLITALHPTDDHDRRREGWQRVRPVHVGANAWIGAGAVVCPGVTVGADAVVGAGAVVTHDVPARTFVAGNPARPVRDL